MAASRQGPHRKEADVIVSDILCRSVPSVHERTGLAVAADLLVQSGLGALPVADRVGRLAGVVSEGDILRCVVNHGHPVDESGGATGAYRAASGRHVVADVMTRGAVTVAEEQEVQEVARLFLRVPWRVLPVVRAGRLVGVVTRTDLVRAMVGEAVADAAESEGDVAALPTPTALGRSGEDGVQASRSSDRR
jgi:CBS domain-containing protein